MIVALVTVSAAALWAPRSWTASLTSLGQWMAPAEDAVQTAVQAIDPRQAAASQVSPEQFQLIEESLAAYRNENAALTARIEELEQEIRTLTATRLWDADGRRLGSRGRLIPARVLGEDVLPWRSSRLLSAGTWQSVREGQAVINRGQDAQVRSGLAILLGQVLVGVVDQPATHTSRVRLISDPGTQMKVRLGRFVDGRFALVDRYFWLTGKSQGRMEVRDVDKRDVDAGSIAVGDVVLSDPRDELLPAALTIGRVAAIAGDRDNPLFAVLSIEALVPENSLDRVYVYDPLTEASGSGAP